MKKVYLLSTDHLENGLWFRDLEDFKVAMNYVAILAAQTPEVIVLAFILMSNHVHFLLKGKEADVTAFLERFKARYSLYYRRKYGVREFLRRNHVDKLEIPTGDNVKVTDNEALVKAVAYVQMNCVAANICAHPSQYAWGTGATFFNSSPRGGVLLSNLSGRARKRLFRSESVDLPEDWRVSEGGFILPSEYVDIKSVETCFRSPQRMEFFLWNSSKVKKRIQGDQNLPAFRDQSILAVVPDLCRALFRRTSFSELTASEQAEFARQIRYRFSADPNQIARVCGISYEQAARLLDSV